jgi:hypothetical protein
MKNEKIDNLLNQFAALRRSYGAMVAALKENGTTGDGLQHLREDAEAKHKELASQLSVAIDEEKERLQQAAFSAPVDQKDNGDYRTVSAGLILLDGIALREKLKQALHDGDVLTIRAVGEMAYPNDWDLFQQVAEVDEDADNLADFEKTWGALRSEKTRLNIAAALALDIPEPAEIMA